MTDRESHAHPRAVGSPFRLDLDQQRRRAKDLLQALRAAEPGALARFATHHPRGALLHDPACLPGLARLSEAQLVIARELRLPSWPRLVAHVAAMRAAHDRIATDAAPDADMPTLHLRCGSDLKLPLQQAGFTGAFLEYADPLCQGPVLPDPDWLSRRAVFLADAYGAHTGRNVPRTEAGLVEAEQALADAAMRYRRVVIWVEHDSYDQLILARCLACFAAAPPHRLELVSVGRYPGGTRFIGLGQLPPEALRLLWDRRIAIGPEQLALGVAVWSMLRADDPTALAGLARTSLASLPHMAGAIRRHCQELPWTQDGLGLTERLLLQLLAEAPRTVGALFAALENGREPLPWLGDVMLPFILRGLRAARVPLAEPSAPAPPTRPSARTQPAGAADGDSAANRVDERLAITDAGRAVLAGEVDALSLSPPDRWLGGVRIVTTGPCWRWDEPTATTRLQ